MKMPEEARLAQLSHVGIVRRLEDLAESTTQGSFHPDNDRALLLEAARRIEDLALQVANDDLDQFRGVPKYQCGNCDRNLSIETHPWRVDPIGCNCIDCAGGCSVPLHEATVVHENRLLAGKIENATGLSYAQLVQMREDGTI